MALKETVIEFVIKRAFRFGSVTRGDVLRVFDMSPSTAAKLMGDARGKHPGILQKRGYGLKPKPLAKPPRFVSEEALLMEIDTGRNDPARTGLFDNELPLVYVSWTNSMPVKEGILTHIIKAIQKDHLTNIVYIGLREGEEPRERKILPLGLERMNDQWRVIALDMDIEDAPIRVFVLSRILDAQSYRGRKPRGFVLQGHTDGVVKIEVTMNPRLNKYQQKIIGRELQVENGVVKVAGRSLHEFERRFTDKPPSSDAVWPPLIVKKS